jgi:hypothetical protein
MWRTADEVKVAARTSAMLWIWSLGSRATGGDPITRAGCCSGLSAVLGVCLADLLASSPSLFPATPLLLSPVDAPCSPVPSTARAWCRPRAANPERS